MAATDPSPAEKLRAQIARMVQGNGLPPEAVVLQSEQTTRVKLLGHLDVRLNAKMETTQGKGAAPGGWRQTYDNMAELNAALPAWQTENLKDPKNLQYATEQILLETNQGWGLQGAGLPMPHLNCNVGAHEKCKQCKGEKLTVCQTCNGQRRHECEQCRGKREMQCPTCFGRGELPSGEDCPACRHQGTVQCTVCQGRGETTCRVCAGKGQMPCAACDAKGEIWQQVALHIFAQTGFKMALPIGTEYGEDILQHLRRLRPEQLLDGRAVITVGEKTSGDGTLMVAYDAEFPVTQLQFNIADIPMHVVLLGEKAAMAEASPFMDRLLAPSLDLLRRARARQTPAAMALAELAKIRFYRNALAPGKKLVELRRRYPFGIGAKLLQEVPPALQYLLSILTEQPRMLAAIGFNAVLAILMLLLSKTNPGAQKLQFKDVAIFMGVLLANLMVLMAVHFGITHQTLKSFGVKPDLNGISIASALGKTGFISIGISLVLCLLAWALR